MECENWTWKRRERKRKNRHTWVGIFPLCFFFPLAFSLEWTERKRWNYGAKWRTKRHKQTKRSAHSLPFFSFVNGKKNQIKGCSFLFLTVPFIVLFTLVNENSPSGEPVVSFFSSYFGLIYNGLNRKREIRPNKKKIKHTIHGRQSRVCSFSLLLLFISL